MHKFNSIRKTAACTLILASISLPLHAVELPGGWELAGFAETELRVFPEHPADRRQFSHFDASVALEPELFRRWEESDLTIIARPFARLDAQDNDRTHLDLRELMLHKSSDQWELKAGVGKVFWGVTESQHLVDVINQTDFVENSDEEEKLGQPMVNLTWIHDEAGTFNFFYLPYFRERTFPGEKGRLRPQPEVDTSQSRYESSWEQWHPDTAVRWSRYWGNFDWGLYYFYGTSRDPVLEPFQTPKGRTKLRPFYNLMHQVGLDAQWTYEAWLLKFEGIAREGKSQHFQSFVGGFEYTFYGVFESAMDVGWLGEYHYHGDGQDAASIFNRDVFMGTRLTLNDVQDTTFLGGLLYDHETDSASLRFEFERRLGERYTVEMQAQWFANSEGDDLAHAFRRDSFLQVALRRYF